MVRRDSPEADTAFEREDEGSVAAATASGGWKAIRQILLGAALEIAAFVVLLLSEFWQLPLTFALFAHLNAVYFFTKGFDRRLIEIRLRRELCFFFALIFPLAGMVGIAFYIAVLKRLESRLNLSEAAAAPLAAPREEEAAFLEDDYFSALPAAFVRRVSVPPALREAWHGAEDAPPLGHFREKEYWRREKELAGRIREREAALRAAVAAPIAEQTNADKMNAGEGASMGQAACAEQTNPDQTNAGRGASAEWAAGSGADAKRLLADTLIEYVTLFHADPRLREHYLARARALYGETGGAGSGERTVLEQLVEIAFLDRRDKECLALCEKLRRLDAWNTVALLRQGECHFRQREYRKLGLLVREIVGSQAVPAGVKEIARMWCQYG